jgi:hypothetical protein
MEKHRGFSIFHFSFAIQDAFFSILLGGRRATATDLPPEGGSHEETEAT